MTLDRFEYAQPDSVDDAVALLAGTPGSRPLAGGQRLLTTIRRRRAEHPLLVDLAGVAGLRGVTPTAGGLRVGAMTTLTEAAEHPRLATVPLLAETLAATSDPQLRNRATVGGAVVAGGSADLPAALLALGARVELAGPRGRRTVPLAEAGRSGRTIAVGEVVIAVELPAVAAGAGGAYERRANRATLGPLCGVAVLVLPSACDPEHVRVAITGGTRQPLRLYAVERALVAGDLFLAAGEAFPALALWTSDAAASADYRRHLAGVLVVRAFHRALEAVG